MQNFSSVHDVPDIKQLVQKALLIKTAPFELQEIGKNKTLVLVFFNPSLRTRLSTQKAGLNLGMSVINLNANQGWKLEFEDEVIMNGDKAEHIKEAAKVISQYADIIAIRSFPSLIDRDQDYADFVLNKFIEYATVPIISMESAIRHPLQSLADLVTINQYKKVAHPKVVLSWAPHPKALPQAVANSFIEWMLAADIDLTVTHPPGHELAPEFSKNISVEYNQEKAFKDADFIYAKNWSPYHHYGKVIKQDNSWMIDQTKMALTNNAFFMHCLPVRRNVVVTDSVIDSKNSLVIPQANNRTAAAQAVLFSILQNINNGTIETSPHHHQDRW